MKNIQNPNLIMKNNGSDFDIENVTTIAEQKESSVTSGSGDTQ